MGLTKDNVVACGFDSVVDCEFDSVVDCGPKTKIGICWFSTKDAALRSKIIK